MKTNNKPVRVGIRAGSGIAFDSQHSTASPTLRYWLASLSTTAACVISMAAPMAAALAGLLAGGRL